MKTISKCITAVLFRLTASIGKSKGQDSLSGKLKTNRLSQISRHDPTKNYSTQRSRIKLKRNPKWFVRFARMAGYSVFILFSANSYLTTTVHAASIVETFKELNPEYHQEFKSDLYEVWVKPIWHNSSDAWELDGVPDSDFPFSPVAKGFEKSFTYKSINDVKSNDDDEHSKCYQYYYKHITTGENESISEEVQFRSESIPDLDSNDIEGTGCDRDSENEYNDVYKTMTHSNNWTTFDVGDENDGSHFGAVRVYIQLNTGYSTTIEKIKYDIRPSHTVIAEDSEDTLATDYKYIKVRRFGEEYVRVGSKLYLKKVLVLDVLQPQGKKWSGQFFVGFNNAKIVRNVLNPYNSSINFNEDTLEKHPLFIFANPLPDWYRNLGDKSGYDGCPKLSDGNLGLPNDFYTPFGWDPGMVVETATYLGNDGVLYDEIDEEDGSIRKVHDLILKNNSKRLCIPGGVYVKGRIIHNYNYHPDLSPGDSKNYNNAKGVKNSWSGHIIRYSY